MDKMTNVKALGIAIEVLGADEKYAEVVEKLSNIKASTEKKNTYKSDKPTKTQVANEVYKADILNYMVDEERYTIADLIKGVDSLNGFSTSKVSALVRLLINDKAVVRTEDKRKAYFSLAH